jgi:hypothetical protein
VRPLEIRSSLTTWHYLNGHQPGAVAFIKALRAAMSQVNHFAGREPRIRISTSRFALCIQLGPDAPLETPTSARSRSRGWAVLSGGAWWQRGSLRTEYFQCCKEALGIATLTPMAYVLVLFAMRLAPVSRVAPVREMSMLVGMYFGARFLSEGQVVRRLVGSAFIVFGVAAMALG